MSLQIKGDWSAMGDSWGCNSKAHVLRTVDTEINPLKRAFYRISPPFAAWHCGRM